MNVRWGRRVFQAPSEVSDAIVGIKQTSDFQHSDKYFFQQYSRIIITQRITWLWDWKERGAKTTHWTQLLCRSYKSNKISIRLTKYSRNLRLSSIWVHSVIPMILCETDPSEDRLTVGQGGRLPQFHVRGGPVTVVDRHPSGVGRVCKKRGGRLQRFRFCALFPPLHLIIIFVPPIQIQKNSCVRK